MRLHDLQEQQVRERYAEAITCCEAVRHSVSRDIPAGNPGDTETHSDYPETRLTGCRRGCRRHTPLLDIEPCSEPFDRVKHPDNGWLTATTMDEIKNRKSDRRFSS